MRERTGMNGWILAALAATVVLTLQPAATPGSLTVLATAWAGPALIAIGMVRHRPRGLAWPVLLTAMLVDAVSRTMWWGPTLLGGEIPPAPSFADGLWLAGDVLLVAGLFLLLSPREDRTLLALDLSAMVTVGLILVLGLLAGPYLHEADVSQGAAITQVVYGAGDVLVLAIWFRMLLAPRPLPRSFVLVLVAVGAFLLSDAVWNVLALLGSYHLNSWVDLGWNLQPLLLGAAALHPSVSRRPDEQPAFELHLGGVWTLIAMTIVGPVLLTLHGTGAIDTMRDTWTVVAVGACTLLIVAFAGARVLLLLGKARALQAALGEALAVSDESLTMSLERHRNLIEGIPAVTYRAEVDAEGVRATYISPQIEELLGFTQEEWLADPGCYWRQLHPDDRDAVLAAQAGIMDEVKGPAPTDVRMLHADGRTVWIRQESRLIATAHGLEVQGFFLDISAHKSLEAERDQMEMELRLAQRLEAVGQLAAGVAHEINTPVQFIGDTVRFLDEAYRDLADLLTVYEELRAQTGAAVDPELLARLEEAEDLADLEYLRERVPAAFARAFDGVERVATIVRAMREFAHPPSAEHAPCDLNAAIRNTLTVARNEYKYVAEVDEHLGDIPLVVGNLGDLGQVFLNLVVNAAHAIEDVRGEDGALGRITITTRLDGDDVVVSLADTGSGIPQEVTDRVFDPFFTTKEVGRGTGQGLAIARTIVVERHGGALTFDTAPGAGTTFHVRLPVAGAPAVSLA